MAAYGRRILLMSAGLWYFAEGLLGPLFATFTKEIGGSVLEMTSAWGVYLMVRGVMQLIIGRLSDGWIGKKMPLIVGHWLYAVCTFLYLTVETTAGLFFVQALVGVAQALASPTWNALLSQYANKKSSGGTWGIAGFADCFIAGCAIMLAGHVVEWFSFTTLFILMGIVQVASAIILTPILGIPDDNDGT